MNESRSEKYLGNIIHNSGSVKPIVAKRLSKGWGRKNEILAIIKEAPLHYAKKRNLFSNLPGKPLIEKCIF